MRKPVSYASRMYDKILPGYEQLRENAGATMVSTEIEPGRIIGVPFYDQDVSEPILVDERPFTTERRHSELGYTSLYSIQVDGFGYETYVRLPYDELRSEHEVAMVESTAWMTKAGRGYIESPNARLFARTLMPQICIGPPGSDESAGLVSELSSAPRKMLTPDAMPLSYVAQAEQAIIAKLAERHPELSLPTAHIKRGKSRGQNLSPGHIPYANANGAEVVALVGAGWCAPDRVRMRDVPEFLAWLTATGLGGVAASACLLKNGQIGTLAGTTSLRPDFLATNLTSTVQALASGETGEMIDWIPESMLGRARLYGLDSLSRARQTKCKLARNENMDVRIIPHGTHGALFHPLAYTGELEYLERFAEEYKRNEGTVGNINHAYVVDGAADRALEDAA